MKKLVTELNLARCDALKTVLEVRGIQCFIKNEYSSIESGVTFAKPELWVIDDAQFEEAQAILREEETEHVRSGDATELALSSDEPPAATEEARREQRQRRIFIGVVLALVAVGVIYMAVGEMRQSAARYHFDRGYEYDKGGHYDQAIAAYSEAARSKRNYWQAYYGRARAKEKNGDLDGAIADFNHAIELNPKHTDAYISRGVAKGKKGDLDGAIADFDHAIELDAKNLYAYMDRGIAKSKKSDYDGAIADCDSAIEVNPKFVEAYVIRGWAKRRKGNWDEATTDYNKAIDLDGNNYHAYLYRGYAKLLKNDVDNAITDYTRAIDLQPKHVYGYRSRGDAYFLKRNWNEALADYRRSCELDSQDEGYSQAKIWLIQMRLGYKETADKELAAYRERMMFAPDDWTLKITAFLLGKTNESEFVAAAVTPDARKDRGQRCDAWFFAGMKRLLAGDKSAAVDCFRKCLATEAKDWVEYHFAQAELKSLGQQQESATTTK